MDPMGIGYIFFLVFPQVPYRFPPCPKAARLPKETYALGIVELVQVLEQKGMENPVLEA